GQVARPRGRSRDDRARQDRGPRPARRRPARGSRALGRSGARRRRGPGGPDRHRPTMTTLEIRPGLEGLVRHGREGWHPRPTLSREDYASETVWADERERVWFGGWVCIGRAEEVPSAGDYLVRDLAGESLFVVRNGAGELRAFYNVCAHRGTKLLDD